MVEVGRLDALGPQGVLLQVQRLGTIRFGNAGVADQHVSQTRVWDMRAQAPSSRLLRVSYTMSDSMSRIRREKENGSENRSDKLAEVGPVCPSATRGRPAAPLHPERRRPAEHRGPAASQQQAGLRAAAVRAPLPGPPAGSGRVRSAGRRGFHRTPARSGWGDELADYAVRSETRHEHLAELRRLYGFRSFAGGAAHELGDRLREEAPRAQSNEDLVRRFVEACRHTRTILPATTTIERICADALVDAERRIEARIAERVPPGLRRDLEYLLEETVDAGVTRFVWLRQFEPGNNSADANRLLDRLEHLRRLAIPEGLFHDVPAHRITRLRRQGERYFADGLRELPDSRRLAILAVCAVEWELFLADAVVETHDRIVGRTYREAARTCEGQLGDETAAVREALRAFAELGTALIGARDTGEALNAVIADRPGWEGLGDLVARAAALANTVASDPLNHVLGGYSRFRRYTPRMLRTLDIEASPVSQAVAGSRRRPAQRRHGGADRLPAAEFEVEPAAAQPIRSPPLGDGGVVPPARRVPRRRRLAGAVAALRRYQKGAAVGSRRR